MTSLTVDASMSGEALRVAQRQLFENSDDFQLYFPDPSFRIQPFAYGRIMQLIVTWGLLHDQNELQIGDIGRWRQHLQRSDHLLVACLLAARIRDREGVDVSTTVFSTSLQVCAERNVLANVDSDDSRRSTIVLPAFAPNLAHSPELHFHDSRGWSLNEEARSLYQNIWPAREAVATLREPRGSDGEDLLVDEHGSRVSRVDWPITHPANLPKGTYRPLLARAFPGSDDFESPLNRFHSSRPVSDQLGEILFELVQNTEWHAESLPGGETGRNIRVISFSEVRVTKGLIDSLPSSDAGLAGYLKRLLDERSADPIVAIATIIDSGQGLAYSAAHRSGRENELNRDNEVDFFKEALDKTIRVAPKFLSEYGLPRVQLLLTSLRGFMSIRSGNLGVRRDFVDKPFAGGFQNLTSGSLSQFERFIYWVPTEEEGIDQGPRVGTDVTFVVPMDTLPTGGIA